MCVFCDAERVLTKRGQNTVYHRLLKYPPFEQRNYIVTKQDRLKANTKTLGGRCARPEIFWALIFEEEGIEKIPRFQVQKPARTGPSPSVGT